VKKTQKRKDMTTEEDELDVKLVEVFERSDKFMRKRKVFDARASKVLKNYIIEEGFDFEGVEEDLSGEATESSIVDSLVDKLNAHTDNELNNIHRQLRILFGLDADTNVIAKNIIDINDMKWQVEKNSVQRQCPKAINDGEDESLLIIVAIGKQVS
jgi:hypothetical protein